MSYSIEQKDADVWGSSADIEYELKFDMAAQHLVQVTMRISNINAAVVVCTLPVWAPGSYKVRDFSAHQGNMEVWCIEDGEKSKAVSRWISKCSIEIQTGICSQVELSYVVYGLERSVRTNHINRNHAFIVPVATLMYVEGRLDEPHHVILKHDQKLWPQCSTQLSPVKAPSQEMMVLGALNYDILADSPIEIGNHEVRTFLALGAQHEVAVASAQPVNVDWLTQQLRVIVETEAAMFGGVPYDRYVFIVQLYPDAGGGLEHSRSSVNAADPSMMTDKSKVGRLLSLLCHEYFHLWNIKRIRPIELGPFNYTTENYTSMLWLAEGVTSYYDKLFHYRCGFCKEDEYLKSIANDQLTSLHRVQGRFRMSVRDSSYLAWVKLYQAGADGANRFPSYYLKGGIIFWLLDLYIISHTDGKRTLDDGMRALWVRYSENPAVGVTGDDVVALFERATGVQLRDRLYEWLDGTAELPVEEIVAPFGISVTRRVKTIPTEELNDGIPFVRLPSPAFTGLSLVDKQGGVTVRAVEDFSPAFDAGIGIDDEILSVNGMRVRDTAHATSLLASAEGSIAVHATCDGRLYATTLKPVPEEIVELTILPESTVQQNHLRSVWLRRQP